MKRSVLPILMTWLVAMPALAATPATVQRPSRLGMCAACHGTHGIAKVPGVPNLAGQKEDYLLHALEQYRDGKRDVAVMRAAVGPLNQKQMAQLAQWFAAQPACGPGDQDKANP